MLHQTNAAKRRTDAAVAGVAGTLVAMVYTHTFAKAFTAATDVIEMGMVPAMNQLHSAELIGKGVVVNTADVGIMTGVYGDTQDETRTCADEIFDGADINDKAAQAATADLLAVVPTDRNLGIGVKLSADVAADATKSVTLVLTYYA